MNIRVFDLREDKKVKAKCLLIDIPIGEYIELIKENIEDLIIQRGKIISRKQSIYNRLTEDLKDGAMMPPLSLILKDNSNTHKKIKDMTEIEDIKSKINEEIKKGDLSVLDGIQRTYCLLNVIDDLKKLSRDEPFLNQRIRAELWYDLNTTATLYKMLVLNTGQVKMSIKHQIEVINISLKDKISEIALEKGVSLKFSTYRTPQPTDDVYGYQLSDIVEAFISFITKNPLVDKTNEVVNELERMDFVEEHSKPEILSKEEEIKEFTDILLTLDNGLWTKYKQPIEIVERGNEKLPWTSRNDIMCSASMLSGIFAAFGKSFKSDKYNQRKEKFFQILQSGEKDPLKLEIMSRLLQDEKKRTSKFGETQRNFFFKAFKGFFDGGEENNFDNFWRLSAT